MDRALERALAQASAVRFLCTGNVVRSAFAELWARNLGCPLPVDSAATRFQNAALFPETRAALELRGVAPRLLDAFRPRHLDRVPGPPDPQLLVLGMAAEHLAAFGARFPEHPGAFPVLALLGRSGEIADPVLEGASHERAFADVAACVEALLERLARRSGGPE